MKAGDTHQRRIGQYVAGAGFLAGFAIFFARVRAYLAMEEDFNAAENHLKNAERTTRAIRTGREMAKNTRESTARTSKATI